MTDRELMQQALDALKLVYEQADFSNGVTNPTGTIDEGRVVIGGIVSESIQTLEAALAQPEQKLIGWKDGEPQYIEQPEQKSPHSAKNSADSAEGFGKRKWVGLTDDDMHTIRGDAFNKNVDDMNWAVAIARKIDFILRKRNT